jgi:hypothetical protein
MSKRGPLAATDKRRQAGHKRPRHAGVDQDGDGQYNGATKPLAHLFTDRRKGRLGEGKRAS